MGIVSWLQDVWNDYVGWWTSDKPRRDPLDPSSPVNSLPDDKVAPDPAKTIIDGIDEAGKTIGDFFQGILDWFGGIWDWIQSNWWLIAIVVVLFAIIYFGRGGGVGSGRGADDRDVIINNYYPKGGQKK